MDLQKGYNPGREVLKNVNSNYAQWKEEQGQLGKVLQMMKESDLEGLKREAVKLSKEEFQRMTPAQKKLMGLMLALNEFMG
jgi:uncharacterized protein (DUF3820 family)